jgi:Uma2 family endonuclease
MKDKFELYEQSQIPVYWIVDPHKESVIIYTLNADVRYVGSRPYVTGDQFTSDVLQGITIDVKKVFE